MQITAVESIEGNRQKLDGGAMFGNAPKALWSRWLSADENNAVMLSCRALLIRLDDGRSILFETGIGAFFNPLLKKRYGVVETEHCLLNNLKKVGLTDADIDIVILSHLHFDHAGGLLSAWEEDKPYQLLFPKAEFWVGSKQWQRACQPHYRDRASYITEINQLLSESNRLRLIKESDPHSLEQVVTFSFSDGHTPGLMLSHIKTPKGTLVFCSDLIPGSQWVHLPLSMGYDRYPELLIDEKKQLLEKLLSDNGYLFFTHDPEICVGKLSQNSKGHFCVVEQPVGVMASAG